VFQNLDRRDGLAGNMVLAFAEDQEGRLWIGTSKGLTCYRRPQPSPPPVYIQAVVADRRYAEVRQLSIPSSAGLVAFEFHSINFKTRPGAMLYRYRLQGRDAQWRTTHARRLEYQGLEPGQYLFQVTAVDRDLNYSMPVAVAMEVAPDARDARIDELESRVRERTRQLEEKNTALEDTLLQLRQTQHQLIVQEKMATLGALVAGIVHELNSPLAAIRSSADVARRGLDKLRRIAGEAPNSEQLQAQLSRVLEPVAYDNQALNQAVQRLGRIVDSLKTFAQLDRAEYQRADVHEGLESAFTLLEYQLKGRIRLERQYGQLPRIHCAPGELNQVFMSVLRNAAQAIEEEGAIRVRTYRDEGWVHVEIADTGRGIPRERLQRIFDPVISRKEERVGMGMGLSLSYSIVAQHQGRIEVQSEPGQGTVVTISLPIGAGNASITNRKDLP
jgi:signal transduction histidine kinase